MQGFPIRTSSDQRYVGNSPRLNAASHVLHRLSMPRHPPYALKNTTHAPPPRVAGDARTHKNTKNKRCSRPLYSSHTPHPHTTTTTHSGAGGDTDQKGTHTPVSSQTPDSAPTRTLFAEKKIAHHAHTRADPQLAHAGVSPPGIFSYTVAAPHSDAQPPHPGKTPGDNKNSLERR